MSASFPPVFLSYARGTSRSSARRLYDALGGDAAGLCFLDTSDIESGSRLPEALVDALLEARVVVAFATPTYFQRWYCQLEFGVARMPSLHLAGCGDAERARALDGLVVALPADGADAVADWLPPDARVTVWPAEDDTEALAALVRARLRASPPTFRERLGRFTDPQAERERLREASRLPPPARNPAVVTVTPPGLSPSIGDAFVGRADDLWRIHAALATGAAGLTGAIEAGGGMGKTRLALEYFHRLGHTHFAGGLFWINGHDEPGPQLRRVLEALDPQAVPRSDSRTSESGLAEAVRGRFAARPAGSPPVLFVVDNVPEPGADQSPQPLQNWCPVLGTPGVAVLATSRMRVSAPGATVVPVAVDVLDPAAAVRLLAPVGERPALAEAAWREVAAWVGHLPLALELLHAALHHGAVTPAELLAQSRAASPAPALDAARHALRGQIADEYLPGISAALGISYQRLEHDAQTAARLLAWLAPAPVPSLVVDESLPSVFSPATRAALVSRHFVVRPEGSPEAFFGTMHRVVADFLRRQGNPQEDLSEIVFWGLRPMLRDVGDDHDARVRLLRALGEPGTALMAAVEAHAVDGEALEDVVAFGSELFVAAEEEGLVPIARAAGDRLLPLLTRLHGEDHEETIGFIRRLMMVYGAAGTARQAHRFAQAHGDTLRVNLGEVHPDVLAIQILEGMALVDEGRYDEADERLQAILENVRAALGDRDGLTLLVRSMQGYMLSMRGRPADAVPLLEKLVSETASFDPISEEALIPRLFLEVSRLHAGRHAETTSELHDLVHDARAVFGEHHPIGHVIQQLEDHVRPARDARTSASLRESLAALRDRYGPDHYLVLGIHRQLSRTLEKEGAHAEALASQRDFCAAVHRVKGDHSLDGLNASLELGGMLRRLGQVREAMAVHREVLSAFEREFGEEHPDTIDAMRSLAFTLRAADDHAGARGLQERVLAIYSRTLGEEHPHTFTAALDLFDTLLGQDGMRAALRLVNPWMGVLYGIHPDLLSPELRVLQERYDRKYPSFSFHRRHMRNRSLRMVQEPAEPRKPWWKWW